MSISAFDDSARPTTFIGLSTSHMLMKMVLNSLLACLAFAPVYAVIKLMEQGLNKAM